MLNRNRSSSKPRCTSPRSSKKERAKTSIWANQASQSTLSQSPSTMNPRILKIRVAKKILKSSPSRVKLHSEDQMKRGRSQTKWWSSSTSRTAWCAILNWPTLPNDLKTIRVEQSASPLRRLSRLWSVFFQALSRVLLADQLCLIWRASLKSSGREPRCLRKPLQLL